MPWLKLDCSKFFEWKKRYGQVNEHNALAARDYWLEDREKAAILDYHDRHPLEGYRRLTFMMLDDVVAVGAASVYRVLKTTVAMFSPWKRASLTMARVLPISGCSQNSPANVWHIDVSHINVQGTFYFLLTVLDGMSWFIVHWDLRESMKEAEVEHVLQRGLETFPHARTRILSDNGPPTTASPRCPIAKDFKEFIRLCGMAPCGRVPTIPSRMASSNAGTGRGSGNVCGQAVLAQ